ncbi:RNase adapter RapZ [Trichlorobacter ammonificans]|uniref:Nucleotide-binding protein Glov_2163 n=1 Tax=Trichlorobacter ammonificans TaxID=2916410 RepID=A0ABN8HHN3_9BACT|nr:RNase adapter RapZ [Trichlorobacter ammonificans]CAH2030698.1 Nucleotide-binding protein Glov_2163 [Trichlorobacter ammonificans]
MRVLVITGMSGSGKSTVVKALEDEGFYCIDNLPVRLFRQFVELIEKSGEQFKGTVLVTDIRGRELAKGIVETFSDLRAAGHQVDVIFLDASDEVLIRRFSETRRRHPADEHCTVPEGIRIERERLALLRQHATSIIDTSEFNVHQLRDRVIRLVRGEEGSSRFAVELISFGFRYGVPLDANLVMDVRFLPNPHFIPELRPHSGREPQVREYVCGQPETAEFLKRFGSLLEFLLPSYRREGKSYLTIAVGCTGGRHRSVALVEVLAEQMTNAGFEVRISHRDMEKG